MQAIRRVVTGHDDTDVAIGTARRDPAAKVRAWNLHGTSGADPIDHDAPASSASDSSRLAGGQASLFD